MRHWTGRETHVAVVAFLGAVVAVDGGPGRFLLLFLLLYGNSCSSLMGRYTKPEW